MKSVRARPRTVPSQLVELELVYQSSSSHELELLTNSIYLELLFSYSNLVYKDAIIEQFKNVSWNDYPVHWFSSHELLNLNCHGPRPSSCLHSRKEIIFSANFLIIFWWFSHQNMYENQVELRFRISSVGKSQCFTFFVSSYRVFSVRPVGRQINTYRKRSFTDRVRSTKAVLAVIL